MEEDFCTAAGVSSNSLKPIATNTTGAGAVSAIRIRAQQQMQSSPVLWDCGLPPGMPRCSHWLCARTSHANAPAPVSSSNSTAVTRKMGIRVMN